MTTRTAGELKKLAHEVSFGMIDLSQVYLAAASLTTHDCRQGPPYVSLTQARVKYERPRDDVLEAWARYVTTVTTTEDDERDRTEVWSVEIECVAEYQLRTGATLSPEACEAFALVTGVPTLHPFAREWTQHLNSQSRYPALTLGTMSSVADLDDDHEVEFPARDAAPDE